MSHRLPSLLALTALLSLVGCASSQSQQTQSSAQAQGAEASQPTPACPLAVKGTQVAASDVEGGVTLTFTTATGDVGALRAVVTRMAEHRNAMNTNAPAAGSSEKGSGMAMMAVKASVEEVPSGARLMLKPEDPANLEALRQHAHQHAEMMAKGICPHAAESSHSHGS